MKKKKKILSKKRAEIRPLGVVVNYEPQAIEPIDTNRTYHKIIRKPVETDLTFNKRF